MRQPRLKASAELPVAYYHCVSRVVNRDFVFGPEEKETFTRFMRQYERFCGVQVVAFCVMSNHFHILLGVPQRPDLADPGQRPSDAELLSRLRSLYSKQVVGTLRQRFAVLHQALAEAEKLGADGAAIVDNTKADLNALRMSFYSRMWDVSAYMKALKQRFTQWFNSTHARKGTLWEERFKSVLVEGSAEGSHALAAMAAYIDLNPVRAGIVDDPKDYRWCSYSQAVAGHKPAHEGLRAAALWLTHITEKRSNRMVPVDATDGSGRKCDPLAAYRVWMFGKAEPQGQKEGQKEGEAKKQPIKKGIERERIREVLATKGKLSIAELLQCRVRHFVDGAVLGSREFVNTIFTAERHRYGPRRKDGARKIQALQASKEDALFAMRDIRKDALG